MKNFKCIFAVMFITATMSVQAQNIKVEAVQDYTVNDMDSTLYLKILNHEDLPSDVINKDDIIFCKVEKYTKPKRGKLDAKMYISFDSYCNDDGVKNLSKKYKCKYAKNILNIDSMKAKSPELIKKSALTVADHFVAGVSYGVNFTEGFIDNKEGNRIKSGAKKVYKESVLSYVEKGEDINIKKGDTFYLILKNKKDESL